MKKRLLPIVLMLFLSNLIWANDSCKPPPNDGNGSGGVGVAGSIDPNEIVGPSGKGANRSVQCGDWMDYTIYFENMTNATAAAQEIRITLPQDAELDWSTLELGEVVFGENVDNGLSGKQKGDSEFRLGDSDNLVKTKVSLADGNVVWYLRSWDPNTVDHFPEDAYAGFLPPNDETHRGEGHVTYRVKVRDDVQSGTQINASAVIVFDTNDPIETDPGWWNTVRTPGVAFENESVTVDEGETIELVVSGGDADKTASAQVYLTYQTASAADIDLKTATVDGVTPKGGVKFPLTLSWAAGEVTNREIRIPVKTDKTVENDETLVFQLAAAQGQELGEMTVCRVTIHDAGYDSLKEKIESGTATKSEQNAWKKLNANDGVPYVAGLASPADRGKVTGGGYCAEGKKVTLKATATKGYAFAGWYTNDVLVARAPSLVLDRTAKPAKNSVTQSVLTGLEESQTFSAAFVTASEDKANIAANVNGVSLTPWESKTETNAYATNIWAGVYLEWPVVASALSETTVKVSGLPSGLKFAANRIYGAPSAASKSKKVKVEGEGEQWIVTPSQVKVTVTTSGKSSQTYQIDTTVDSLPSWAVGTFTGPSYDTVTTNGLATVTIGANGKISAKQPVNGKSTSFAAKYFDSYRADESAFHATLTAKVSKETVTNEMVVGGHAGRVTLPTGEELVVTNGCVEADLFDARQYNWKVEPWKTLVKTLNKQTLTYVILSDGTVVDAEDDPNAVGKVTLKFAANGSVSVAGEFVAESGAGEGRQATVKAKGSTVVVPADDGEALVFVYLAPKGLAAHARCVRISFPTGL